MRQYFTCGSSSGFRGQAASKNSRCCSAINSDVEAAISSFNLVPSIQMPFDRQVPLIEIGMYSSHRADCKSDVGNRTTKSRRFCEPGSPALRHPESRPTKRGIVGKIPTAAQRLRPPGWRPSHCRMLVRASRCYCGLPSGHGRLSPTADVAMELQNRSN
jgi:hypothetical protein